MKKRVLIIEDDKNLQKSYLQRLSWKVELLQATTCMEAKKILNREVVLKSKPNLDIISFDFNLDSTNCSIGLLNEIRNKFNWILVAASSESWLRRIQLVAWCTDEIDNKENLVDFILSQV